MVSFAYPCLLVQLKLIHFSTLNRAIHALLLPSYFSSPHKFRVSSISKISSTSSSSSLPSSHQPSLTPTKLKPKIRLKPTKISPSQTQNPIPIPASTMNNTVLEPEKNPNHKPKISSFYSPKLYIYIVIICVLIFILFQIQILSTPPSQTSPSSSSSSSWSLFHQKWRENTDFSMTQTCKSNFKNMVSKLRSSITFLPIKDLRYTSTALQGHTWFMSSMFDQQIEGEVQFQKYPSESSNGRLLCIKGNDTHDGSWNSYGFAYPEALPTNATYKPGLTFISYNHYNYDNIWHGLSALVPFVAWHRRMGGCAVPSRWILYHWGELRKGWGGWVGMLMEAAFGVDGIRVETLDEIGVDGTVCFEEVVVMRHNEGGMNRERRLEVYDLLRCKARVYCNVSLEGRGAEVNEKGLSVIGMTMFMRTGARSFKNQTAVMEIFEKECAKVEECRFRAAYSNNLTFCEQVSLMSSTDILISPHGAQLTNMFFMDRNSSVMEFFPKGWLKLAGVGQYVYHWIASWSGMKHQGAWRDPNGEHCEFSEDDRRCFSIYKSGMIGHNETQFSEWASNVLNEVKKAKQEEKEKASTSKKPRTMQELMEASGCACG